MRQQNNNLLSSLDEVKATARNRGAEVQAQREERLKQQEAAKQASGTDAAASSADSDARQRLAARAARRKANAQGSQAPRTRERAAHKAPEPSKGQSLLQYVRTNWRYIALVVASVLVVVVILMVVRSCTSDQGASSESESASSAAPSADKYVSPYDWSKIERSNNRMTYAVDGKVLSKQGIDVSENQGYIDWEAVAADGIDFAMIRVGYRGATEGGVYPDTAFEYNFAAAREAGLDVGVYFFSQATNADEAIEEADFVVEQLGGAELEYPIAFDSEDILLQSGESRTSGLSPTQMSEIQTAFYTRIKGAGYDCVVYGNAHDIGRYSRTSLALTKVWWAEYNVAMPTARIDFVMWQYSNAGVVDGISTEVDMNIDLSGVL